MGREAEAGRTGSRVGQRRLESRGGDPRPMERGDLAVGTTHDAQDGREATPGHALAVLLLVVVVQLRMEADVFDGKDELTYLAITEVTHGGLGFGMV